MSDVFAFTGVAGTGVAAGARKLASRIGSDAEVVPIDDYVWEAFTEDARNDAALRELTFLPMTAVEEAACAVRALP